MTTRDLLSLHETVSRFEGIVEQPCFFLTSLCPDNCGHGGSTAVFAIQEYLNYEKPGEYGDPKSEKYHVRLKDSKEATGLTKERLDLLKSLVIGDIVLLSWNHDYVHKEGCSYPERPITKLVRFEHDTASN
ncbi:flp protein [Hydra vulgaris]|uniref:Flp n=1 Tax=Hydra vulgaris TaxID=6087 RepID=Q6IFS3_HYDVU|nr:flp protein [Hydra vulgaris]AAX07291.1 flp [Hydra vulgaris]DAA05194.1 TPA_exp: flp [Hydra vulgaris]DAA05195.1 TPA_exp: flp [Hydra vulgaris]